MLKETLLEKWKPVKDCNLVREYYNSLSRERLPVQYDNSYLWLHGGRKYFNVVYRECLLIIKKAVMHGHKVWNLNTPPISLHTDKDVELEVLKEAHEDCGLNCRFTEYEVKHYGIDPGVLMKVDGRGDFIYNKDALNLEGPKKKKFRNRLKKFMEYPDLRFQRVGPTEYTETIQENVIEMLNEWVDFKEQDGGKANRFHLKSGVNNFFYGCDASMLLIRYHGKLIAHSITEHVGNNNVIILDRKHIFGATDIKALYDPALYIQYMDAAFWNNWLSQPETLHLNIGNAGGSKSLREAKLRMNPELIMPIYKYKKKPTVDSDLLTLF